MNTTRDWLLYFEKKLHQAHTDETCSIDDPYIKASCDAKIKSIDSSLECEPNKSYLMPGDHYVLDADHAIIETNPICMYHDAWIK